MKKNEFQLSAPIEYMRLSPYEKRKICNGCGSRDGIDVPDTIYFMSISRACNIHDFMYQVGETHEDKKEADETFLKNMNTIIDKTSSFFLKRPRRIRAYEYYLAVKYFGDSAFWNGKQKPKDMK